MKTIYLDMDGVVADFDAYTRSIIGYAPGADKMYPDSDWAKIRSNERLYRHLPLCTGAKRLVENVIQIAKDDGFDLKFLTAVPHDNDMPWAFWDKIKWAENHFPGIPVWFGPYSVDKQILAKPGDILIDDRTSNIEQWKNAGGIGILHRGDVEATLDQLYQSI